MVREPRGLGCSPFARHYSGNHCCFLFLPLLRCFSSRRSPHINGSGSSIHWVAPFGDLGITGHLHLPRAYRSLSRPSSPSRAKASACCPFLLLLFRTHYSSIPSRNIQTCSITKSILFLILRLSFRFLIVPGCPGVVSIYFTT